MMFLVVSTAHQGTYADGGRARNGRLDAGSTRLAPRRHGHRESAASVRPSPAPTSPAPISRRSCIAGSVPGVVHHLPAIHGAVPAVVHHLPAIPADAPVVVHPLPGIRVDAPAGRPCLPEQPRQCSDGRLPAPLHRRQCSGGGRPLSERSQRLWNRSNPRSHRIPPASVESSTPHRCIFRCHLDLHNRPMFTIHAWQNSRARRRP